MSLDTTRQSRPSARPPRSAWASARRSIVRPVGIAVLSAVSCAITFTMLGSLAARLSGNHMAPWIIGRAAGLTAYLLLMLLALTGLLLSHPGRARVRRPATATRIRIHVALAVFTAAVTALHIVALATDRYAGVGWLGTVLPMHASYRPVATTLGVIGLWSGLLSGITASLAGRLVLRIWWPIHKVAIAAFVLIWAHAVLGGGDTPALLWLYLASGGLVLGVALWRYMARTPSDVVDELAALTSVHRKRA